MSASTYDAVVVGRGIIGLSIAWRLSQAGLSVASIDARQRGQATKAAAGMLAPLAESNALPALAELGIPSLQLYPDFLAELSAESGVNVPMNGPGILRVALNDAEEAELRDQYSHLSTGPFPVDFLDRAQAHALEPTLAPSVQAGMLSTAEKHVIPVNVIEALDAACQKRAVVEFSETVTRLRRVGDAWSIEGTSMSIEGKIVVVACGVWSRDLLSSLRFDAPITPLKGQLLQMKFRRIEPPRHTVYAHSTYIVPRSPSEVMLGTTEEQDTDASLTPEAIADLRERGDRLLTTIAEASLQRGFAGLRPISPDRLPLLGRVPGSEDLYIAGGHGRNGILLTPISAKFMRDLILDGVTPPETVNPARFA